MEEKFVEAPREFIQRACQKTEKSLNSKKAGAYYVPYDCLLIALYEENSTEKFCGIFVELVEDEIMQWFAEIRVLVRRMACIDC